MKKAILTIGILFLTLGMFAQDATSYWVEVSKEYMEVKQSLWEYSKDVARTEKATKYENRRKEMIESFGATQGKVEGMEEYRGDSDLRDAVAEYIELVTGILEEDYANVIALEENANESYEGMEAYIIAKDEALEKQMEAVDKVNRAQDAFVADHNVKRPESAYDFDQAMIATVQFYDHYNEVSLLYLQASTCEKALIEAINEEDVEAIKQQSEALAMSAGEGIDVLNGLEAFEGDAKLIDVTISLFEFYMKEAQGSPLAIDYCTKKERYEKVKEAFDQLKKDEVKEEDQIDYDNALNKYNASKEAFNALLEENEKLQEDRSATRDKVAQEYAEKYNPGEKK